MSSKTIFLIHGLFLANRSWDPWVERYQARGYTCVAPEYPGRDKPAAELKRDSDDPTLKTLTLAELIDHHARMIRSLDEKPILIGHSFGGLMTQLLLQRDLGVAGVAIDSAPPQGLLSLEWSFLRSAWPALNLLIPSAKPINMSFGQFRYAFAHTLSEEEARAAYDQQIVPDSRLINRGALTKGLSKNNIPI